MIGPYTYPDGNDGITAITIFKYDKTKSGEANGAIGNLYIIFYGVPGFRPKRARKFTTASGK